MSNDLETSLRCPTAYSLGREALQLMETHGVWPTPLNYEIWLYVASDPSSAIAIEVSRLVSTGTKITEDVSESLAGKFISRMKLNEEVRDAGTRLTRELASISTLISDAQKSQSAYSKTLEGAREEITHAGTDSLASLVAKLANATQIVLDQHSKLEVKLNESSNEVNRLRKHLDQVRHEAMTDALTNLANRKAFDERLEQYCDQADKTSPLTLAIVDIDYFKRFNDTWGHQTGDQVLRYVASVLARLGNEPRFAARYGGEEFALLFPRESIDSVEAILNEARQEIASRALKRRSTNEDLGNVSISAGIAVFDPSEDMDSLINRADLALYESKNNGRNQVTRAQTANKKANAA